jgi:8-oxo-dGTP pyrophosphatase MutT (NUDIX family)
MKHQKACGAVIFRQDHDVLRFLLIKQKHGGHWGFPKGMMDEGETEQETARREVREETGLAVKLLEGFRSSVRYSPNRNTVKEAVFFLAHAPDMPVKCQASEIEGYSWCEMSEAVKLLTFENSRGVLKEAYRVLKDTQDL